MENLTIVCRAVSDDSVFYKKILSTREACARFAAMKTHAEENGGAATLESEDGTTIARFSHVCPND